MVSKQEENEIEMIKEFFKIRGYKATLETFEKEEGFRNLDKKKDLLLDDKQSKYTKFMQESKEKIKQLNKLQDSYKLLDKKHKSILQCGRQIFAIVINCLQQLHNIKDGNQSNENLGETIENYKAQIGKYHKIIMNDEWDERTEIMNQQVMIEHKKN